MMNEKSENSKKQIDLSFFTFEQISSFFVGDRVHFFKIIF